MRIGLPNQITLGRLGLAIVFLALLAWFDADRLNSQRWLLSVCFWLFLLAAVADVLDGLLARLLRSETTFGRVVDPVVDKVLVCGAFLIFASESFHHGTGADRPNLTGVQPWMVVVIVARELMVSAVRAHSESTGREFGASWMGKLKMFVQSAAICAILAQLAWDVESLVPVRIFAVWIAVIITVASALSYLRRARDFLGHKDRADDWEEAPAGDEAAPHGPRKPAANTHPEGAP